VDDGVETLEVHPLDIPKVDPQFLPRLDAGTECAFFEEVSVEANHLVARFQQYWHHHCADVALVSGNEQAHPSPGQQTQIACHPPAELYPSRTTHKSITTLQVQKQLVFEKEQKVGLRLKSSALKTMIQTTPKIPFGATSAPS
jgi:hypothetical protein